MEYIINKPENKHLLILVHGLNGSAASWKGGEQRFAENLTQEELIRDNFNLALFTYPTMIFRINWLAKIINLIRGFFRNRPHEDIKGFNVGINSISRTLGSEIRTIHGKYDSISVVAHSMGGLVIKSALTWLTDDIREKIPLFISLSVPHIGSNLARLGSGLLGGNPQIIDLRAMGKFTTELNLRYADLDPQPYLVYQSGNQDEDIVPEASAIPPNVPAKDTVSTQDDHFSVLLIKDRTNNQLFERIIKELNRILQPFSAIDIAVAEGTPFQFFVEMIASRLKIKTDMSCFSKEELATRLRADQITSSSVEDLFMRAGDLAISALPGYIVKKEKGTSTYLFNKIPVP